MVRRPPYLDQTTEAPGRICIRLGSPGSTIFLDGFSLGSSAAKGNWTEVTWWLCCGRPKSQDLCSQCLC